MSSCYSPRWKRFLFKVAPFLWKQCPEGNYHWRWDRFCFGCLDHNSMRIILYEFRTKRRWETIEEKESKS